MRDMKLRDIKMRHHVAGVENTRHENARNAIVWNTACCMSIAAQDCMSRLQRAQISPSSKYYAHRVICVATVVLVGLISPPTASWVEMKRWSNQQSNSLSIKAEHACYIRITLSQNIISTQPKEWSTRWFRKEEVTCTHTGISYTR